MSFNATSSLLCVSSATDTVHIFKLAPPAQQRKSSDASSAMRPSSSASQSREKSLSPVPSDSEPDLTGSTSKEGSESLPASSDRKSNGTLMGMIRRTSQNVGTTFAASVGAYLPQAVSEIWEPARDFAWLKIPKAPPSITGGTSQLRSVVAMSGTSPQVMVVTNEGRFYVFGINLEKGGEGTLVKEYEVGGESERMGGSAMDD